MGDDIADGFLRFAHGDIRCAHCGQMNDESNESKNPTNAKKWFSRFIVILLWSLCVGILLNLIYEYLSQTNSKKLGCIYF